MIDCHKCANCVFTEPYICECRYGYYVKTSKECKRYIGQMTLDEMHEKCKKSEDKNETT